MSCLRKKIQPNAALPDYSGAECLRQVASALGTYIASNKVARALGSRVNFENNIERLSDLPPLVLGDSLDLAFRRIGIDLGSFDAKSFENRVLSGQSNFKEMLVSGLAWSHKCIQEGQPVLLLLQGEIVTNVSARKRVAGTNDVVGGKDLKPLTWCIVDSVVQNKRESNIAFTFHTGTDMALTQRTSASLHLPSLHRISNVATSTQGAHSISDVMRASIPRSIPLTLRSIRGYVSPFIGTNQYQTPSLSFQSVICKVNPPSKKAQERATRMNRSHAPEQITAVVTLSGNEHLLKSHTLYMFDSPENLPSTIPGYFSCNCAQSWDFIVRNVDLTWSITVEAPESGLAIFRCIESLPNPKDVIRKESMNLRRSAQKWISGSNNTKNYRRFESQQSASVKSVKTSPINNKLRLTKTRTPPNSRRSMKPKSLQNLPTLTEVETLPKFMHPAELDFQRRHKLLSNGLFINERKAVKRSGVSLRVFVHIDGEEYVINCGEGKQSIKWLALAAAERYRADKKGRAKTLPGHIVGTNMSSHNVLCTVKTQKNDRKMVKRSSEDLSEGTGKPMISSEIAETNQWELNLNEKPSDHHIMRKTKLRFDEESSSESPNLADTEVKTSSPYFQQGHRISRANGAIAERRKRERSGRAFTPSKGPEEAAKRNRKAEKKAINAAEARFKVVKLLNKSKSKSNNIMLRNAKRKFFKLGDNDKNGTKSRIGIKNAQGSSAEINSATKIQAIHRGRVRRRRLQNMNRAARSMQSIFRGQKTRRQLVTIGDQKDSFAAVLKRKKERRKQSIVDSVVNKRAKKGALQRKKGLGSNPDPFVPIKNLLSDGSHCWIELQKTKTDLGDNPVVTSWMDKAFYKDKHSLRNARLENSSKSMAGQQAAYWASVMAKKKIEEVQTLMDAMDKAACALQPDLLFKIAQLVRKFAPRLLVFFGRFLALLRVSEHDRAQAKVCKSDLKIAIGLVGPNVGDSLPPQVKVEEAFVLTLEAMKVASCLLPEEEKKNVNSGGIGLGADFLENLSQPNFNVSDLLRDSKRLHETMHVICSAEWDRIDETTAFGIATQVDDLRSKVEDVSVTAKWKSRKLNKWAETASKVLGNGFNSLSRVIERMLEKEAEERASMTEFDKLWAEAGILGLVGGEAKLYRSITAHARQSFTHQKNVFQYYAVIGGGIFDVSFSELMLFLKNSGAYIGSGSKNDIDISDISSAYAMTQRSTFKSANATLVANGGVALDESARGSSNLDLNLVGWMQILVRVALLRYGEMYNDDWDRSYDHFIKMNLTPVALDVISDEAVMKVALRSPEVKAIMKKYSDALERVFIQYSNEEGEVELDHYVNMVTKAGLIDADLTRLECRRSFVRSQIAAHIELNEAGFDVGDVPDESDACDRSMDFNEFMSSLPRLGADKWDSGAEGDLPIYIKQERISSALASLEPARQGARKFRMRM